MFAVVESGGRQYRVSPGEVVRVEKLDAQKGDAVKFEKVILVSGDGSETRIGMPYVAGAMVSGKLLAQNRTRKITVFRYKPKKRVRVKRGHRQPYSVVRIESINV